MNPTAVTQPRILAPDVARGFTMLGIAVANATTAWLYISPDTPGSTAGGVVNNSILDKIAIILGSIFTHVRGLPMFATLLGYGVGMIAMSLQRRNYPPKKARLVLIRRYFFLAIFGILHLSLLFFGDIMFVYGVMGIILALLYRFKDKTLLIITGVLGTLGLILAAIMTIGVSAEGASSRTEVMTSFIQTLSSPDSYATLVSHAFTSLSFQIGNLLTGFLFFFPVMILGMVAARHNVLGQPEKYKTLLTRFAIVAVIISFGVGIPLGLAEIGVLPENTVLHLQSLNQVAGIWAGPGIVASIALATLPLQRRIDAAHAGGTGYPLPVPLQALIALGKRSMTGYLLQSILFVLLTSTFTIGLGRGQGAWEATLIAILIWAITLVIAYALEKANLRGPFEVVHRRLSYGRTGLTTFTPTQ
jgi:membrane protein